MYKKLSPKTANRISKFFSWYAHKFHNKHGMYVCYDPMYYYNRDSKVYSSIKPIPIYMYIGKANYEKIGSVYCKLRGLMWKDKFDSPRHEENPKFTIKFLWWKLELEWTTRDFLADTIFWETILDIVYYGKPVKEAIKYNTWNQYNTWNDNKNNVNLETLGYFSNPF